MTETILLAPFANGTELCRSLAAYGVPTIGLRVLGAAELARLALLRTGVIPKETVLARSQEPAVIDSFLREIPYFANASYADSEKLAAALNELRALIPEDEEAVLRARLPSGEFPEKNEAVFEVYTRFLAALAAAGLTDGVSLIRRAIGGAAPLSEPILTLREYPLSPLERKLAEHLSGGAVRELTLPELFRREPAEQTAELTKCYGTANETEAILNRVFAENLPLDTCTVAVTDTSSYAQLFYDWSREAGFEVTFGCGVPILNANPARLLKVWLHWDSDGYHAADALHGLLFSEAFDRGELRRRLGREDLSRRELEELTEAAGRLRLGRNAGENQGKIAAAEPALREAWPDHAEELLACLRKLGEVLTMPPVLFLNVFSNIRRDHPGRLDRSALNVVTEALDSFFRYHPEGNPEEIVPELLNKTVCSENSREGALFVTSLQGAMAGIRPNLFIAGLSADLFPGSPRENYLLLDSDLTLFAEEPDAKTSAERVRANVRTYRDLRSLAAALGANVRLSYSDFDLAELKERNLSSVLTESVTAEAGFFSSELSRSRALGRAYQEGTQVTVPESVREEIAAACSLDAEYSPSALTTFFDCPRRFLLQRMFRLEEEEETDPFEVLSAAETGTLIHSLMESLANSAMPKEDFLRMAEERFDAFLLTRVPPTADSAAAEKKRFCQLAEAAYLQDPHNEVLAAEEEVRVTHETGVKLHGYPDRIEKLPDGTCLIVDYKTGRKLKHEPDDIDTCLQVAVYAYLAERRGIPITACEFRYPRLKQTVPFRWDSEMKERLTEKLEQFRSAMQNAAFPLAESEEACKYCRYQGVCGKEARE